MAGKRTSSTPARYHHVDLWPACVAAATALLAEQGIEAVTMRAVARRISVSRSAPYRHFVDKRALLAACAAEGFARLTAEAERLLMAHEVIYMAVLREMMMRYGEIGSAEPALYRLMFASAFALADYPVLSDAGDHAFKALCSATSTGQASGHLAPGDTCTRTLAFWAIVHGLVSLCNDLAPGEQFDAREWATHLAGVFDVLTLAFDGEAAS